MNEFYTWATIGTYAGAVALTAIIVQAFKGVGIMQKIPTQLFSYAVAAVLLICAQIFTGSFSVSEIFLCLVNAVVVSLASNGTFEAAMKTAAAMKKDDF